MRHVSIVVMQIPTTGDLRPSAPLFSVLLGFVAGCALQLQQEVLWSGLVYGSFVLATCLGFGLTGLGASVLASQSLAPRAGGQRPDGDGHGSRHAPA